MKINKIKFVIFKNNLLVPLKLDYIPISWKTLINLIHNSIEFIKILFLKIQDLSKYYSMLVQVTIFLKFSKKLYFLARFI